jgi:dienelactone hydrolase
MCIENKIIETSIRADGIVGKLYRPTDDKTYPGVIVLGGSGGGFGWSGEMAARLAHCRFAALALAYFRHDGLPKALVNIPLEYFETAVDWISRQERITTMKLAVVGGSRGGELALLLASRIPRIKAVVAYAPSSVVWGADGGVTSIGRAAWSYRGRPLPYMKMGLSKRTLIEYAKMVVCFFSRRPYRLTPLCLTALENKPSVEQVTIPVEKIQGPILLISGEDDQLWPAAFMCEKIVARLKAFGSAGGGFPCKHVKYEGAGHAISLPDLPLEDYPVRMSHPLNGVIYELGGTLEKNAQAAKLAWAEVVSFLDEYVRC